MGPDVGRTKDQQFGEWADNPFTSSQVLKELAKHMSVAVEAREELRKEREFTEWVDKTYPELRKQYEALKDLADAGCDSKTASSWLWTDPREIHGGSNV